MSFTDETSSLQVYERLQRWRRREAARWPGLFRHSMSPPLRKGLHSNDKNRTRENNITSNQRKSNMVVERLRNGLFRVLIDNAPIVICDGCGALLPLDRNPPSSASTISPQSSAKITTKPELSIRCEVCNFLVPLGAIRRLLGLPPCGPEHAIQIALSLLIEAVGIQLSMRNRDPELHSWFLDRSCRTAGLDALLGAIGVREEQLYDSDLIASQATFQPANQIPCHYVQEADAFFRVNIPNEELPPLPCTIDILLGKSENNEQIEDATTAIERAAALVLEILRIWSKPSGNQMTAKKNLLKMKAVGREFSVVLTKVRMLNHSENSPIKITTAQVA